MNKKWLKIGLIVVAVLLGYLAVRIVFAVPIDCMPRIIDPNNPEIEPMGTRLIKFVLGTRCVTF